MGGVVPSWCGGTTSGHAMPCSVVLFLSNDLSPLSFCRGTELPMVLRGLTRAMQKVAGKSPAEAAEFLCATMFDPGRATGFHVATEKAGVAAVVPEHDAAREFVWGHTQKVLAAGKSVQPDGA
eukprot:SAG22_NODE_437_length_10501_cov_3.019804_8_plen_123_part_00